MFLQTVNNTVTWYVVTNLLTHAPKFPGCVGHALYGFGGVWSVRALPLNWVQCPRNQSSSLPIPTPSPASKLQHGTLRESLWHRFSLHIHNFSYDYCLESWCEFLIWIVFYFLHSMVTDILVFIDHLTYLMGEGQRTDRRLLPSGFDSYRGDGVSRSWWNTHSNWWCPNYLVITDHVCSTREGDIFTGVCLSTWGVGSVHELLMWFPPPRIPPGPWATWPDQPQTMSHLTWLPPPRPWTTWPNPLDHEPPDPTPPLPVRAGLEWSQGRGSVWGGGDVVSMFRNVNAKSLLFFQ